METVWELTFHLAPRKRGRDWEPEDEAYSQAFIRSVGLQVHSGCWASVGLDDPRFDGFLDAARQRIRSREAVFYGHCTLVEEYRISAIESGCWYLLRPRASFSFCAKTFRAFRVPRFVDVATDRYVSMSETVRRLTDEHGLRGLEFVWIPDHGKYAAKQWFVAVPSEPIGRGLDHPWVDPARVEEYSEGPDQRTGAYSFSNREIREGAKVEDGRIAAVLELFEGFDLHVLTVPAFLEADVPNGVDFAYGMLSDDRSDFFVAGRAARILVEAGSISLTELTRVDVLSDLSGGHRPVNAPPAFPAFGFLTELDSNTRREREAGYVEILERDRPPQPTPTIAVVLKELRRRKREDAHSFARGISVARQQRFEVDLPDDWRKLLAITNGGYLSDECAVLSIAEIEPRATEVEQYYRDLYDDPPIRERQLPIASAADGDWYSLLYDETGELLRVARITHEGGTEIQSWRTIAEFIEDELASSHG